jgi:hypothetical protein
LEMYRGSSPLLLVSWKSSVVLLDVLPAPVSLTHLSGTIP